MSISIVIPALDEEESIGQVLAAIPKDGVPEIIVVDGGSTDATVAVAEALGALVIHEPKRGYGQACMVGAMAAQGDIVVFLDADGADDPRHIPDLLGPILAGEADMVLGSRLREDGAAQAMPWHQRVGNQLAARLIQSLCGLPLTDLSPFRAIRRRSLMALDMEEMTHGWPTEMIVKAARRGYRIVEVPVRYHRRLGGRSKISGTVRGTILAGYHILRSILSYGGPEAEADA